MNENIQKILENAIPENTKSGHRWAIKKFHDYMLSKNNKFSMDVYKPSNETLRDDLLHFFEQHDKLETLKDLNNASLKQVLLGIAGFFSDHNIMSTDVFKPVWLLVDGAMKSREQLVFHFQRDLLLRRRNF